MSKKLGGTSKNQIYKYMERERTNPGLIETWQLGFESRILHHSFGATTSNVSFAKVGYDTIHQGIDEKTIFTLASGMILLVSVVVDSLIEGREKIIEQNHEP